MSRLAWPAFTEKSKERHLVVIEVPADVPEDPAALVGTLIELVRPKGNFALCRERTAAGARLFCAFETAVDADMIVEVTNAQEENVYSGWATEYHCRLDAAAAEAIRSANHAAPEHGCRQLNSCRTLK